MLRTPAARGTAAFGKTRQGPPRRATAPVERPREAWMTTPVPAIVKPEVFAAVQEQRRDNQRHARQYRRGAKYLLQGLISCQG